MIGPSVTPRPRVFNTNRYSRLPLFNVSVMHKLVKGACDWFLCRYEYIEMGWVQLVSGGEGEGC